MNPFFYGLPATPAQLIGRRPLLRRIVGRIVNHGQSTALVGEPHLGKSSLLQYLEAPQVRNALYGEAAQTLIFATLDSEGLPANFTSAEFWERVLLPLKAQCVDPAPDSDLAKHYQLCQSNQFGMFTLETLLRTLHTQNLRLVVLLDEFDQLLYHPILCSAEFFGGLRMLASRSQGALVIVAASRLPLSQLNAETQRFNPTGSPYFNIFAEFILGGFTEKESDELLALAGERFSAADRHYLRWLAGGHPYLLQAAASSLWDIYTEGVDKDDLLRSHVLQQLYSEHTHHFSDTWRVWSPQTRQAFTSVALLHAKGLLLGRTFDLNDFLEAIPTWEPELKQLEMVGMLQRHPGAVGGWRIKQNTMLAWLTDELLRSVRADDDLAQWLQASELERFWKRGQREAVVKAITGLGKSTFTLAERLLQAYAAGSAMGEAIVPGQPRP